MQETKLGDLEDWSRLDNVRILDLLEGTETVPMEPFLETCLPTLLPHFGGAEGVQVERTHRNPGRRLQPGAPERINMARMLRYKDKLNILTVARQHGNVEYNGNKTSFYPDYGIATQKEWKMFMDVKKRLRDRGLSYVLLPPVRLRVD
ncbi:hypothetical protein NDU88_002925 [Pleurodeles waltl]|uniref:Uncharacterized protein n=1 Tax=Pleurodeles waltl TaxID=8319 RepID=A0AAV7QBF4_PLEWA|nr:hypothetical protein NDU88_002925 [Pleurodeles waltl]